MVLKQQQQLTKATVQIIELFVNWRQEVQKK